MSIEEVNKSLEKLKTLPKVDYSKKDELAKKLINTVGHPLYTLSKENEALKSLIEKAHKALDNGWELDEVFNDIRDVSIHYAVKGDLFYPLLKVKYEISGPSDVMWTTDDEIRDDINALAKDVERGEEWKENSKCFRQAHPNDKAGGKGAVPVSAVNFTDEEWHGIYRDRFSYDSAFGIKEETWDEVKDLPKSAVGFTDKINMPTGSLSLEQLEALMDTIPMEITFVDVDDTNAYYNDNGEKFFKRPQMSLGRKVYSCHPPKVETMVRAIIADFKSGKRNEVQVWSEKKSMPMCIIYREVRDKNGNYLGTAEFVQNMTFAKNYFTKGE
ncbi:MAG: PAS domain-containing protein [Eubacterium sp.]